MHYATDENPDAIVTAAEYSAWVRVISPDLISVWRRRGKIQSRGKRGREHLYRYGDLKAVERETRIVVDRRGGVPRKTAA